MTFDIITLGCKVNTYESAAMHESLTEAGFIYDKYKPDITIVNTCSVTNEADKKSFKLIRRIRRENSKTILVVCGCSAQNNNKKYCDLDINILIGNKGKSNIVNYINDYIKTKKNYSFITTSRKLPFEQMKIKKFMTHTRAFLKIQDGCDNFCSYCIIPFTRGASRSRDFNECISEAKNLVDNNHQEIVLTGINTGSYHNASHDLCDLINEMSKITNLKRIRISSIEITELNNKFMNLLKENKIICDHLHIPLQSGSENVLKVMKRKYDLNYFLEKINEIRKIRPNISISTDVIVGHPLESNEDFLECMSFCKLVKFSKIHVFPFSKRDGTASSFLIEVDEKVKKERAHKLISLANDLEFSYASGFIGQILDVLTEEREDDFVVGHTSNYLKVYINEDLKLNMFYKCKIIKIEEKKIIASLCTCVI